jgi:hypothetical protein
MRHLGPLALILLCSCQPKSYSATSTKEPGTANEPFVSKSSQPNPQPPRNSSDESEVVIAAMDEFFTNRWQDWNVGDLVALEPAWTTSQFDLVFFDKALDYWFTKFGNASNPAEQTLHRIKETLVTAGAPPATGNRVEKGLNTMNLGNRVALVPKTYFDNSAAWVAGAVDFQNGSGAKQSLRASGSISYPLFSGDRRYAFVQMSHVKAGNEYGQLHFFLEKLDGNWKTLAVGRVAE